MRGVETRIQEIRHAIFTEVAKMAYDTGCSVEKIVEEIPYHIIPGETGSFRSDVFLERAIVGAQFYIPQLLPYERAGCALGIGLAWTAMILVMSYLFEKLFLRLLDMAEERLKKMHRETGIVYYT